MGAGDLHGIDIRIRVRQSNNHIEIRGYANQQEQGQKRRERAEKRIAEQPMCCAPVQFPGKPIQVD